MSKERYLEQEINKDLRILELERKIAEAREEVDYAINFFNKNEQFGVVGILEGIKNKLKEKGDE